MNSPWPAALMFAVPIALGVLYLFARFPLLDRILDSLRDRYESWTLDRDIRRAFKEAQMRMLG